MNLVFSTRLPRIGLAALALVGAVIAAPRFANASAANITFAAPTITDDIPGTVTTADQTGYFDVTITDSVAGDTLAQFVASLSLNQNGSNVTITGADLGQLSNPYATGGSAANNSESGNGSDGIGDASGSSPNLIDTYVLNGNSGNVTYQAFPDSDSTDAFNSDYTNTGTFTLAANTAYSLMQVYYDIPVGTPVGSYQLYFDQNAPYNAISDPGGDSTADAVNLVSNTNTNSYVSPGTTTLGAINVVQQTPEPSSIVLMVLGAMGLIGLGWRRARQA